MKFSVIMPSYLGFYKGCASDREVKFCRAVSSFIAQQFMTPKDAELIIVSDGCQITNKLYKQKYNQHENIHLIELEKQKAEFSGAVRNAGIKVSKGEIITYLDTDDVLGEEHLLAINRWFSSTYDWVYWDDFVWLPGGRARRNVSLKKDVIGTSAIAHRRTCYAGGWPDGWGHDWAFIQKLMEKYPNHQKIQETQYVVCHVKGMTDM